MFAGKISEGMSRGVVEPEHGRAGKIGRRWGVVSEGRQCCRRPRSQRNQTRLHRQIHLIEFRGKGTEVM
jgi:hypothetical protein